jgi:hypothetical protein
MDKNQPVDVASEPVDLENDADYMDTGVLHEERVCSECGKNKAAKGYALCSDCQEKK